MYVLKQTPNSMYDLDRILRRMDQELSMSVLPRTLKQTGYDMNNLSGDYYKALLKALMGDLDEDDPLIYFVLVVQEIVKLELQLDFVDLDDLWQDTWQTFENLIRINWDKN